MSAKRLLLTGLLAISLLGTLSVVARDPEPTPQAIRSFMRPKLAHSQKLLEGLTLEQFYVIRKEAQELSLLSQASDWQVLQTEPYLQHSAEFRRSADAIRDAAAKKNLDGAAIAYVDMTLKCINCHKYVRGVRMADLGLPNRAPAIR